ncbi:MAG: glycosyltransferase family 4 protein [Proteobacteria bacterium]|nr:glycosyltransferase family 4 protein [Pseudomonadota bacterium]
MKKKYRVLLFVRWPVGGIRTFVRYIYKNFDPLKYEFTILGPDQSELKVLLDDLKMHDIACITFKADMPPWKVVAVVMKTILLGRFDLIHSQGFMAGLYSSLPARISRTKHIMTSHDVLMPKQFVGLKGALKKLALSSFLPMIDTIHSVSNDAHNNLLDFIPKLQKRRDQCIAISNGIDIERFQNPEKRDFRKELNLSADTFLIGFLGRFMSQKGFVFLVDAIEAMVKERKLPKKPVVLSFGFDGFVREDTKYLNEKGLQEHFHFLPFTSNIASTLKGLDVVAMPSLWEACPLLPMEAMVAGVPVIGTDCLGLREVLTDTPNVILEAGKSQPLAAALEHEIRTPTLSQSEAFRDEAALRFDVRKQSTELEQVILNMLKKS